MTKNKIYLCISSLVCIFTLARCVPGASIGFSGQQQGGSSSSSSTSVAAVSSAGAFQTTVFPLIEAHCAQCHASSQAPYFATSDSGMDFTNIMSNSLVNLTSPQSSILYTRLALDNHNCWSDCTTDANLMEAAIAQWNTLIQSSTGSSTSTSTSSSTSTGSSTSTSTTSTTSTSTSTSTATMQATKALLIPAGIPTGGSAGNNSYTTLTFALDDPASTFSPKITGAKLVVQIQGWDNSSYRIHNPSIMTPTLQITDITDLQFGINGVILASEDTYSIIGFPNPLTINKTVGSASTILLQTDMEMEMISGPGVDTLTAYFGSIMAP